MTGGVSESVSRLGINAENYVSPMTLLKQQVKKPTFWLEFAPERVHNQCFCRTWCAA